MAGTDAATAAREAHDLLGATVDRLRAAHARDEALAEWKPARRLIPSQPTLVEVGRAWRLGSILLTPTAELLATGRATRSVQPKDFNADKSVAAEARRELQRAAVRGRIPTGDVVNFEYTAIDLSAETIEAGTGAVRLEDGVLVLHEPASTSPLEAFIADRVALLLEPF